MVIAEQPPVAAVVRADRSPPEPIRTITDLVDLGTAVSEGEADHHARLLCATENNERAARRNDAQRIRRTDLNRRSADNLGRLLRKAIVATSILHQRNGTGLYEPLFVWRELAHDPTWKHVIPFAQRLGIRVEDILPRATPEDDGRPENFLRRDLRDARNELVALINDWQTRQ
jgi:hypothetical protein